MHVVMCKDTHLQESTFQELRRLRLKGYLIFILSEEPYFYVYKKYYKYANGFITNKGHYGHMGCCQVILEDPIEVEEKDSIYYGLEYVYGSGDTLEEKYGKDRVKHTIEEPVYCSDKTVTNFEKVVKLFLERNVQVYLLNEHDQLVHLEERDYLV